MFTYQNNSKVQKSKSALCKISSKYKNVFYVDLLLSIAISSLPNILIITMATILIATICVILVSIWLYLNTSKPKGFPPGPPRFPFFGSLTFMLEFSEIFKNNTLIHAVLKNVDRYGKVFGFYIGSQPYVVVANYEFVKEVLKHEGGCDRPDLTPINELRPGHWTVGKEIPGMSAGIAFSQGTYWKEQRRFLLRNLRDFGFGKTSMEDTLLDEVEKLCNEYSKYAGSPVCLDNTMNLSVINSLWAILTGEKLPIMDPKLVKIVSDFNASLSNIKNINNLMLPLSPRPMIRLSLVQRIVGLHLWRDALKNLTKIIEAQVNEHKATMDPDNIRDMTDLFLNEIESQSSNVHSSFYKDRGYYAMINNFIDLFVAGMETTSSSIIWTFLYLLHHPDVKKNVQNELDKVDNKSFIILS